MRKGKYFEYSKTIMNYLYDNDFSVNFTIDNRCSNLSKTLDIPKTSFFDVLALLENQKIVLITKKNVRLYDGLWVGYFSRLSLTRKGLLHFLKISED